MLSNKKTFESVLSRLSAVLASTDANLKIQIFSLLELFEPIEFTRLGSSDATVFCGACDVVSLCRLVVSSKPTLEGLRSSESILRQIERYIVSTQLPSRYLHCVVLPCCFGLLHWRVTSVWKTVVDVLTKTALPMLRNGQLEGSRSSEIFAGSCVHASLCFEVSGLR